MTKTQRIELPYRSIPDMFLHRVAETPDALAFGHPAPDDAADPIWLTWREVGERARAIGAGLTTLGVQPEDRVAVLSSTRLDWILADLGIMLAGAATTTVYPTTEPEEAVYIVADSGSKVLIAENPAQAAKIQGADLPNLTAVVLIDGAPSGTEPVKTTTLAELEEAGRAVTTADPELIDRIAAGVEGDQLATLIYTSGTTGRPKGVELLHAGWVWQGMTQQDTGVLNVDDLQYLWLPLAHSFGKTLLCGILYVGVPTYVDGRVDKIIDNLGRIHPTLMCAAPRIFEKVYNRVVTGAQADGGAKWKIFSWAVVVGKRASAERLAGREPGGMLKVQAAIADKLVFSKLRARLGGRMRAMISGSAPLSAEIGEFFFAAGLPILEGYGLTETSAGSFVNREGRARIGTVGQALGDLEVKLDTDGEVLLRGTPVMRGYHNLPDETAAAFTEDGWFRTGDIGELDADGYLRITDRKKDLIKTSGGKYVAPSYIEGLFKSVCPYTSQAIVVGQARNYVTMLITLDPDAIKAWAEGTALAGKSYAEIAASKEAEELVAGYVNELNTRLNRWETVKKFKILGRDLSIEDGELTPSLKVKRRAVEKSFEQDIDRMYAGALAEI
ncbi:long-chain fatty acid--CoA ligase [Dactylosporangium sp. NPDC000555]|uniref:AMP-dependent synthetase/ligase n=1 Tax=Dactylosporangium sp. NPDC000555 TaxID=3154260 RepID=UPI00332384EF